MEYSFESGPIRPPSEAASILLRVTRNCPWNRCVFCPVYKGEKFSSRTVAEIKKDIDAIAFIAAKITGITGENDNTTPTDEFTCDPEYIRQVSWWLHCGMKSLFLQDADSLVIKTDHLIEILNYTREKFPSIERITSYSRAKTVSKKSLEELEALRNAGLDRIHIGMESGSANVLNMINKGITPQEQVIAGQKAITAGFELSEYFMPGIGGAEFSREHAVASAHILNQVNPTFIRLRTTRILPGTPLEQLLANKLWTPLGEIDHVKEIKLFIENLNGISSVITSDHIMNLIEDAAGKLPQDKDKILSVLGKFLEMKLEDQESFIIGRRLGYLRYLADYTPHPQLENIKAKLKTRFASIDEAIRHIAQNY